MTYNIKTDRKKKKKSYNTKNLHTDEVGLFSDLMIYISINAAPAQGDDTVAVAYTTVVKNYTIRVNINI